MKRTSFEFSRIERDILRDLSGIQDRSTKTKEIKQNCSAKRASIRFKILRPFVCFGKTPYAKAPI